MPQPFESGFLGFSTVPITSSARPLRQALPGARRAYSHSWRASQPSPARRSSGPHSCCVRYQRRYAACTSVGGCQAPVSRRTWARISPSTVNSVICVSSVTAPRRPYAGT